ncbi:MAG: tetratricopeptide repeat protein [Chloroflexota bacterium]
MNFHLQLLGSFAATVDQQPIQFRTDKIRALLAYLAVEGGVAQRKERLATLLWDNQDDRSARTNLRVSFSRMRQALDKQSKSTISKTLFASNRQTIQLVVDDLKLTVRCDETLFQRLIATCEAHQHQDIHHCSACLARLEQTAVLYRGEFLQGIIIDDSDTFSEWLLLRREQLHQQALNVLGILVTGFLAQNDIDKVRNYGQRLLELEPWHEKTHRQLMLVLARNGQRSAAMTQYKICEEVLWEEMGVEPGEETAVLYQKIRDREPLDEAAASQTAVRAASVPQAEQADRPKHNLPSTLTPYFGRQSTLAELTQLLLNPDHRFVTLLGEGGVGKTRLSLEVARRVLNGFGDGVWFVPLAGLASGNVSANDEETIEDDIASAIAQVLNHSLSGKESPKAQLIRFLQGRHLLLILDNVEHLLDGADLVYDLLQQTTAVSVLCSSRIPLGFMAEYLFPLKQLPLPPLPDPNALQPQRAAANYHDFACVQLFADRARRTSGWFELEEGAGHSVAELCHLVAGIPLGIELAAASLQQRTLAETIVAIRQSLDTVSARLRDIPKRHRSMRAVFENSWALLTETERQLLAQLSVFRGGFAATAVSAITNASVATLESLHKKSLLTLQNGRYALHQLLRQFASEKLTENETVASRHSRYYLQFLAEREQALAGEMPQVPAAEITIEFDNIRHGWHYASTNQQAEQLLAGLNAFADFLLLRGRYRESERLFGQAAQRLQTVEDASAVRAHARLLIHQTSAFVRLSQYDQAISHAQHALHQAEKAQDPWSEGYAHLHWGESLWRQGSYQEAISHMERVQDFGLKANNSLLKASGHYHLNIIYYYLGNYDEAKACVSLALPIWRKLKNTKKEAYTLNSLGLILLRQSQSKEAKKVFTSAMNLANQTGDFQAEMNILNNLSMIATENGDFSLAEDYLNRSLRNALMSGDKTVEATALYNLGWTALQNKDFAKAHNLLMQSLKLRHEINDSQGEAAILKQLGDLATHEKRLVEARQYYTGALEISTRIKNDLVSQSVQEALSSLG